MSMGQKGRKFSEEHKVKISIRLNVLYAIIFIHYLG